jgi:hypothetical protein
VADSETTNNINVELDFLVLQLTVRVQLKPIHLVKPFLLATILIMGSDGDLYIGNVSYFMGLFDIQTSSIATNSFDGMAPTN